MWLILCNSTYMARQLGVVQRVLHVMQVLFVLAPGIESIYEPAMEEMEEAIDTAKENVDHIHDEARQAVKRVDGSIEKVEQKIDEWIHGRKR